MFQFTHSFFKQINHQYKYFTIFWFCLFLWSDSNFKNFSFLFYLLYRTKRSVRNRRNFNQILFFHKRFHKIFPFRVEYCKTVRQHIFMRLIYLWKCIKSSLIYLFSYYSFVSTNIFLVLTLIIPYFVHAREI